jgi:hypothetical protein
MDILKKSKQYLNQHKLFMQGVPSVVFCFLSTDRRPVVPTSLRMLKQSFCWETHSCDIDDMPSNSKMAIEMVDLHMTNGEFP